MIYSEDKNRNWFSEADVVREFSGASVSIWPRGWTPSEWRKGGGKADSQSTQG